MLAILYELEQKSIREPFFWMALGTLKIDFFSKISFLYSVNVLLKPPHSIDHYFADYFFL